MGLGGKEDRIWTKAYESSSGTDWKEIRKNTESSKMMGVREEGFADRWGARNKNQNNAVKTDCQTKEGKGGGNWHV